MTNWEFIDQPEESEPHEHPTPKGKPKKVPLSMLYRWYMYDMDIEDRAKYEAAFDLTAISDEGREKELHDSVHRVDKVEALAPFFSLYAAINADYMFEAQRKELLKAMPDLSADSLGEHEDSIKSVYRSVSFAALLTAVASAVELGIMDINGSHTEIG